MLCPYTLIYAHVNDTDVLTIYHTQIALECGHTPGWWHKPESVQLQTLSSIKYFTTSEISSFIPVALCISGPNDSLLNQQMAKNISIYLTQSISQIDFSLSLKILKGTALCFLHQVAQQVYTFLLWGITGCSIQSLITHKIQKLSLHTETLKLQTVPINCL